MLGGSVDVTASFFENAIQLASEGHRVQSFVLLQERPGFVLAVSPASPRKIRTVEDLKGAVIGVTTPGSASHHFVNYLLLRHHIPLTDVSITGIGLGPTSVAAFDRGHIDAGVLIGSSVTAVEEGMNRSHTNTERTEAACGNEIAGIKSRFLKPRSDRIFSPSAARSPRLRGELCRPVAST
jgi:ABC-type nitrate/sulfonate/bicarbonate transport system substrate-binding protein